MAWALGVLHNKILGHDKAPPINKAEWDAKLLEHIETYTNLVRKFEDAFIRSIYKDATKIQQEAQKNPAISGQVKKLLEQIEAILRDIRNEEYHDMRKGNFLRRLANHLRGEVKKGERQIIKLQDEIKKRAAQAVRGVSKKKAA